MTQDNLSCLRFSVEESIWFQKGQEVSELLSISLDPDISIEEDEQYVSIRGALILSGEYKIAQNDNEEQSLREYTSGKQVQDVMFREDGLSEFYHRFPLDITIPKNRIQNMEDLYVSIDMFDYDLPQESCLSLTADLAITGLYGEQQSVARVEETEDQQEEFEEQQEESAQFEFEPLYRQSDEYEEEVRSDTSERNMTPFSYFSSSDPQEEEIYEPLEIEVKKENSAEREEIGMKKESFAEREEIGMKKESFAEREEIGVKKESSAEREEVEVKKESSAGREEVEVQARGHSSEVEATSPSYFPTSNPQEEEAYEPLETEVKQETSGEEEQAEAPAIELRAKNMVPLRAQQEQEEAQSREEAYKQYAGSAKAQPEEEQEEKPVRNENALYLTQLFSKNAEEDFSPLKICIVQNGDSLEKIAERYDINVQNLIRVNNLEDEHSVEEGMILNIPIAVKR
ncbi:stage VI sporulation protein D [Bacillus songklensis]|uniref:Stage VI sporulation protein D n=1 Tax=Bacillus songklensis TaxID=1069116 RepID=A0ABV8B1M3_9BACI